MIAARSVFEGTVPELVETPPSASDALDHRGALAELGRLHGRPLPGRAGADRDQVEAVWHSADSRGWRQT